MSEITATEKALEKVEQPAAPITLAEKPNTLAKIDLRELRQIAEIMVASGAFDDVKQVAQAQVKIMAGAELGFSPIVSMTGIHFFKGKVTIGANLIASLIKQSPKYDYEVIEHTSDACAVQFYSVASSGLRKPLGPPVRYTVAEAKTAGLTSKDTWTKYPADLLFAAVMRQGGRRHCADVLRGTTNEVDTPDDVPFAEAETETINGDKVDVRTGEVLEEAPAASTTPSPETGATPPVEEGSPMLFEPDTLSQINALMKIRLGDGEVIDEDEAKKFLKGRNPAVMPEDALTKLLAELKAL